MECSRPESCLFVLLCQAGSSGRMPMPKIRPRSKACVPAGRPPQGQGLMPRPEPRATDQRRGVCALLSAAARSAPARSQPSGCRKSSSSAALPDETAARMQTTSPRPQSSPKSPIPHPRIPAAPPDRPRPQRHHGSRWRQVVAFPPQGSALPRYLPRNDARPISRLDERVFRCCAAAIVCTPNRPDGRYQGTGLP